MKYVQHQDYHALLIKLYKYETTRNIYFEKCGQILFFF